MRETRRPFVLATRLIIQDTRESLKRLNESIQIDIEKALFTIINLCRESNYEIEADDLLSDIFDFEAVIFDNDRDELFVIGGLSEKSDLIDMDVLTLNVANILMTKLICPLTEMITEHEFFNDHLRHCVFSHLSATNDIVLEYPDRRNLGV